MRYVAQNKGFGKFEDKKSIYSLKNSVFNSFYIKRIENTFYLMKTTLLISVISKNV